MKKHISLLYLKIWEVFDRTWLATACVRLEIFCKIYLIQKMWNILHFPVEKNTFFSRFCPPEELIFVDNTKGFGFSIFSMKNVIKCDKKGRKMEVGDNQPTISLTLKLCRWIGGGGSGYKGETFGVEEEEGGGAFWKGECREREFVWAHLQICDAVKIVFGKSSWLNKCHLCTGRHIHHRIALGNF